MPEDKDIYFLTQVNFVPLGSLLDLVIYPHTQEDMKREGRTEDEVRECLRWACCSPEVLGDEDRADLQFTFDGRIVRPALRRVRFLLLTRAGLVPVLDPHLLRRREIRLARFARAHDPAQVARGRLREVQAADLVPVELHQAPSVIFIGFPRPRRDRVQMLQGIAI